MIRCHWKRLFRTMMAANGESMGKSTSTKRNIQGTFSLLKDMRKISGSPGATTDVLNWTIINLVLQELLQMHLQQGTRLQSNKDGATARRKHMY